MTSENYTIPLTEGLIWVEFTKTTSDSKKGRGALEANGSNDEPRKEHWDIEEFIRKAAKSHIPFGPSVAIKSSIPMVGQEAKKEAQRAASDAARARRTVSVITVGGVVAALSLWASFFFGLRADIGAVTSRLDAFQQPVASLTSTTAILTDSSKSKDDEIKRLASDVKALSEKVELLRSENAILKSEVERSRGSNSSSK